MHQPIKVQLIRRSTGQGLITVQLRLKKPLTRREGSPMVRQSLNRKKLLVIGPYGFFNETTGTSGELSLFTGSARLGLGAHVAQLAEHILGKDEVISSSLIMGSKFGLSAVPVKAARRKN